MTVTLIRYEEDDVVAVISLDRPAKRNAINNQMVSELEVAFQRFASGPSKVAVLTSSSPEIFCAGADLKDPPSEAWRALPEIGFRTDKPIIAALGGKVIGLGFMLSAMCDLCVASEDTEFHFPEAKLGFSMAAVSSATNRLPLRVAMELLLLGRPLSAQRAYDTGFVNDLVPPGTQVAAGIELAHVLARNSADVMGNLKRLTLDVLGETPGQAHYLVRQREEAMMLGPDAQEGLSAFQEKRAPVFKRD